MPFKSKAQWRKFFAMARDGEIPAEKAKEWAKETKKGYDALPEHTTKKAALLKVARALGVAMATKEANMIDSVVGWGTKRIFPTALGAGIGAGLAGEGHRGEGAIGGAIAGHFGSKLLPSLAKRTAFTAEEIATMLPYEKNIAALSAEHPDLYAKMQGMKELTPALEYAGRAGGAAAAGYGVNKFMNQSLNDVGIDSRPAVSDMAGHYTGLTPEYY